MVEPVINLVGDPHSSWESPSAIIREGATTWVSLTKTDFGIPPAGTNSSGKPREWVPAIAVVTVRPGVEKDWLDVGEGIGTRFLWCKGMAMGAGGQARRVVPAVQAGKVLEEIVPDAKLKLIKRPCGARGRWIGIKIHIIVTF